MSDDAVTLIAVTALNRMFEGDHFSICTVRDVAAMLRVIPDDDAMRQLKPLHCVNWCQMPRELRKQVPLLIQRALSGDQKFRFELAGESSQALNVIDGSRYTRRPLLTRIFGDR